MKTHRVVQLMGVLGLAAMLGLAGCSTKHATGTTSAEPAPTKSLETGSGSSSNQPLTGFSKSGEELVRPPSSMTAANTPSASGNQAGREIGDVYFAFDKWALSNDGKQNLLRNADVLRQNPAAPILIEGYCDERGSREYNLVLGEKRAKETQQYLLGLGIRNPVKVISYGKERAVCSEHDESCYWKNRRAHLVLSKGN